jgi:hypothetical protein
MQNFFFGGGAVVVRPVRRLVLLLALLAGSPLAWSQAITSFLPASGPIGASVTITGSGFNATAAQNVVFFGATQAAVTAASTTSLTVTVPLGATYRCFTVTNLATGLTAYSDKPFGVTLVGAATFQPKVDFGTGTLPSAVATGDLNGDGRADLVTTNYDDNTVSVLRNTSTAGTVSFAAKADFATAQGPVLLNIGDLDGDGKPDLAVTSYNSRSISVLRNTSAAGAVSFARVDVSPLIFIQSVVIGDVDGDGLPDLVGTNFDTNNVVVLRNTSTVGAVSFAAPVYFGTESGVHAVILGDVNGDGLPDLVVTNYTINTVSVFRNTSTPGTVSLAARINYGATFNPNSLALGDLDADGLPDLAIANSGGNTVSVLHNTSAVAGAVSFAPLVDYTVGNRPQGVAIGDVDGDGLPDLAVANPGSVHVLRNTSVPGTISLVTQAVVTAGAGASSVAIGDLDGDGKPDLVTANETANTVSVLRQQSRVTSLFLSQGTLSPAFATGTLAYTASVGNAVTSIMVGGSTDNPAATFTINGTAVANGTYSGPIALAVGSNTITVTLHGVSYTVTVTRAAGPALISLSPTFGPVGTSVTLTGSDLTGAVEVDFAGAAGITTGLTVSGSGSNQTITVTVPAGAITGPVTVATPNGTTNGVTFTVTYPDLVISTGTTAAPVAVAAGTYNSITVTGTGVGQLSGAVVVNTAVTVQGTLLTSCQPLTGAASFTLAAGATLGICDVNGISTAPGSGAVQTTGVRSFSSDATYIYNGTQAQSTGNALPLSVRALTVANPANVGLTQAVAVAQVLTLASTGNLLLNFNLLLLRSDANGTALVANTGSGVVVGSTATLQRHIETNPASGGYRHYASPMVASAGAETLATLATTGYVPDFSGAAAYNSSATPGLVTPFPTVFLYNQDRIAGTTSTYDTFGKGWQASLGTEVPQVGRGYSVQAPGAALVDFTGTLTSGSVSRSNLQRASADPTTGWHLLGNPYPSPLDWSTMTLGAGQSLEGVDGALYVFQSSGPYAGQYRTYLASAPGSNSPIVPSGSGFFIHTTSPATAGLVRFNANNRVTSFGAQPAFGRSSGTRPVLTLALNGRLTDAVTLYLDPAATAGVDAAYDATKLTNPSGLNLAVLNGSTPLAIDGRPLPTATTVLPLTLAVPIAGTYTLRVEELTNFTALPVYLRDAQAGTEQLLTPGYTVSLTLAAGATTRFSLVLRPAGALATAGPALAAQASIYPNPAHAAFTLTLPPVAGATHATATLLNTLGQVVNTRLLPLPAGGATAAYSTAGLAAGVYALRLQAGGETAILRVVVE